MVIASPRPFNVGNGFYHEDFITSHPVVETTLKDRAMTKTSGAVGQISIVQGGCHVGSTPMINLLDLA